MKMLIKVNFIGKDWGYYVILDQSELMNDIKFDLGDKFKDYIDDLQNNSGEYFENYVISVEESIGQSDNCPPQIYFSDYKVELEILEMLI